MRINEPTAPGACGPSSDGPDPRRWLIRKSTESEVFDCHPASIIGPSTEPIYLAPEALLVDEYDGLCGVLECVVDFVVTRGGGPAEWEMANAVRNKLGDYAADRFERIILGDRWWEAAQASEPKPAGTGAEGPSNPEGGAHRE